MSFTSKCRLGLQGIEQRGRATTRTAFKKLHSLHNRNGPPRLLSGIRSPSVQKWQSVQGIAYSQHVATASACDENCLPHPLQMGMPSTQKSSRGSVVMSTGAVFSMSGCLRDLCLRMDDSQSK